MSTKTIHVDLSVNGVERAIRQLEQYQMRIEQKTAELVDRLVKLGEAEAKASFRSTATVDSVSEDGTGIIEAVGENVIIMEFGAGMATMEDHPLAGSAPVDEYRWSYSEQVGSGEGLLTGRWHFGGIPYDRVEPRHGMLDARDVIVDNVEFEARKVFV